MRRLKVVDFIAVWLGGHSRNIRPYPIEQHRKCFASRPRSKETSHPVTKAEVRTLSRPDGYLVYLAKAKGRERGQVHMARFSVPRESRSACVLLWRDVGRNVSTLRLSTEWHRRNCVYCEIAITLTLGTCIRGGTLHNPLLEVLTAQMLMMMIDSKQNFRSRIIFRILDE